MQMSFQFTYDNYCTSNRHLTGLDAGERTTFSPDAKNISLQQQEKTPFREIPIKKRITVQPGAVSVLGAEARAAVAGGRCTSKTSRNCIWNGRPQQRAYPSFGALWPACSSAAPRAAGQEESDVWWFELDRAIRSQCGNRWHIFITDVNVNRLIHI